MIRVPRINGKTTPRHITLFPPFAYLLWEWSTGKPLVAKTGEQWPATGQSIEPNMPLFLAIVQMGRRDVGTNPYQHVLTWGKFMKLQEASCKARQQHQPLGWTWGFMTSIYHAQNFEEDFLTTNHGFLMDVGGGTHPRIRIQGHEQFQKKTCYWLFGSFSTRKMTTRYRAHYKNHIINQPSVLFGMGWRFVSFSPWLAHRDMLLYYDVIFNIEKRKCDRCKGHFTIFANIVDIILYQIFTLRIHGTGIFTYICHKNQPFM